MKKLLILGLCLVLTSTLWAENGQPAKELTPWTNIGEGKLAWEILSDLNAYEKSNALVDIELGEVLDEVKEQARNVVNIWNSGDYEGAIELLRDSPDLQNACIGIQWKEPLTSSVRWGDDVQIGSRDSVSVIALDADSVTGNLFAVLKYTDSGGRWSVNISADTGKTWAETYTWGAITVDVDGIVFDNYFYVAYSLTDATGRIRRFLTSNGSVDATYGYITVIDEGVDIRDIALTTSRDYYDAHILYFAIMDNDSLENYWDEVDAISWERFDPDIGNADRGLDACYTYGSGGSSMWASYIGVDDSLYAIGGWGSWTHYGPFDYAGYSSAYVTSISGIEDTVMIAYPQWDGTNYEILYRVTYNNGTDWTFGTIYSSTTIHCRVTDLTGRLGDGFGVAYQTPGLSAQGFYRHRTYHYTPWTAPEVFTDSVPKFDVKPSIERVASGLYGIVYADYPVQNAYFDRIDFTGVEEHEITVDELSLSIDKNIFSNSATIQFSLPSSQSVSLRIIDQLGRPVKMLVRGVRPAGTHSVSWFSKNDFEESVPGGVYFAVLEAGRTTMTKKLILMK